MVLLIEKSKLQKLSERQFGAQEDEDADYSLPDSIDGDDTEPTTTPPPEEPTEGDDGEETPPPEDGDGEDGTEETPPDEEGEGEETPPEDGDGTEEDGGDDYTMEDGGEEVPPEDGDDTEETPPEEDTMETEEGEGEEDPKALKKAERLLAIYKNFYAKLELLSKNVSDKLSPLNSKEEYIYKNIVDSINNTKTQLFAYINDMYNRNDYDTNVFQLYYFSSQVEMVHILIKKLKSYREEAKTI